ncbi:hypothetical protein [Kitasatospora sp. NPDC059571]|uniref:hypothetical protein n=1 Tax=Kitasatospora sp. NPDC059571 TaxID=3346871 RepID=UPI0036CD0378
MTTPAVVEGAAPGRAGGRGRVPRAGGRPGVREAAAGLRRSAGTPPGRLRLAGAVLAALALLFGAAVAWQAGARADAADRVVTHSQPLSRDATEIYRSLADADTTAATGFLLAGDEPAAVRKRYEDDLATAAALLTEAAAQAGPGSATQALIGRINQQLPQYAGLVETARTDNRQGLPLGGAYLRYASALMQDTVLPAAQQLAAAESAQLDRDSAAAESLPWPAGLLGVAALAALIRYQVVLFRRTHRVLNPGLAAASAAVLAAVLWVVVGGAAASAGLAAGRTSGSVPLRDLGEVRTEALQARAAENLDLVARGASDVYAARWQTVSAALAGRAANAAPDAAAPQRAGGGALERAYGRAPAGAAKHLASARDLFATWDARHAAAARSDRAGDYDAALRATVAVGDPGTTEAASAALDRELAAAADAEQARFDEATAGTAAGYRALAAGAAVLAVLAAAGTVRGIGRRLAEYR